MSKRWLRTIVLAACVIGGLLATTFVFADVVAVARPPAVLPGFITNSKWLLRLPLDEPVVYRGVVGFDGAGANSPSILYPAPNLVGLLAAVLTHGAIIESTKNDQKSKLQQDADKVLSPYRDILAKFSSRDLLRRALTKTANSANGASIEKSEDSGSVVVVASDPVFSLTQDQKAIVLDNTIDIQLPGTSSVAAYRNVIRIVSMPLNVAEPSSLWLANDGQQLKDESVELVAVSIDIASLDAAIGTSQESLPYRTVRYREGSVEKMERAQILNNRCGRLLIRTLRGMLLSVPASVQDVDGVAGQCALRAGS